MKRFLILFCMILSFLWLWANPRSAREPLGTLNGQHGFNPSRAWRLLERVSSWREGDNWIDDTKVVYNYHGSNTAQVDSLNFLSYNPYYEQWEEYMYVHASYLPGGEYIESTVMGMRMAGMSFEVMMTYAIYDNLHRLTHWYIYIQPLGVRTWNAVSRLHFVYTANNQFTIYGWADPADTGDVPYWKNSFTWDGQGRMVTELEQDSPDSTNWADNSRITYTWHPNDTTTTSDIVDYIAHTVPQMGFIMFDGELSGGIVGGMPQELLTEEWNGSWMPSSRETYAYNANDTLSSITNSSYQEGAWVNDYLDEYTYDANQNPEYVYHSTWESGAWVPDERTAFIWGNYTGVPEDVVPAPESISLVLYPIPFTDGVNISVGAKNPGPVQLEIFNLRGQKVHQTTVSPNSVYNWSDDVPSGVYLIKANQDGYSVTRRIVKLR